jgi:hypothetical protein
MKISVMECLDWNTSNRPEQLASFSRAFMDAGVDLEALWTYRHDGGRQIAAISRRPSRLEKLLKSLGIKPRKSRVLFASGPETPAAVPAIIEKLSSAGIKVNYADVLGTGEQFGAAVWVEDKDIPAARRALHSARTML